MSADLLTGYLIGAFLLGILFFCLSMIMSIQTPEKLDMILDMGVIKEKKE